MLEVLLTFLPVAAMLTVTPGVATALVIRSSARGGRREAVLVTIGLHADQVAGALLVLGIRSPSRGVPGVLVGRAWDRRDPFQPGAGTPRTGPVSS